MICLLDFAKIERIVYLDNEFVTVILIRSA